MEQAVEQAAHDGHKYRIRREAAGISREEVLRRTNLSLSTILRAEIEPDWSKFSVAKLAELETALEDPKTPAKKSVRTLAAQLLHR